MLPLVLSSWVFTGSPKTSPAPRESGPRLLHCALETLVFWWGEADEEQVQNRLGQDTKGGKSALQRESPLVHAGDS